MIQLPLNIYDTVKSEYYDVIKSGIRSRCEEIDKSILNPFTYEPVYELFFDTTGKFDWTVLEEIICQPLVIDTIKNDNLRSYFKTGLLLQNKGIEVRKIASLLELPLTRETYRNIRKKIVEYYMNGWIEDEIIINQTYYYTNDSFQEFLSKIERKYSVINEAFREAFNYEYLTMEWRHRIIVASDVTVCPYCNRNYVSHYSFRNSERTTADLEHFYPKSMFTLFGLSLYNFIPACALCNRTLKRDSKKRLLSPFERGFGTDVIFEAKMNPKTTIKTLYGEDIQFDLGFNFTSKDKQKVYLANNSIEVFRLKELYSTHKGLIRDAIYKQRITQNPYYHQLVNDLGLTSPDAEKLLLGCRKENINIPFSKLLSDIDKQGGNLV